MKIINKIRIWSFIICFSSFGIVGYGPDGFFLAEVKAIFGIVMFLSALVAVVTTFIALIDSAGNGLNTLQRKKDAKRDRKRH